MKKSRVLTLGLACFLGAVTTFSALAGTLGGGGVFSHETRINTDNSGGQRLSAEEEKIAAEMQADLLAGTLELDPEKDPVLGTTESGVTIRYHNKALSGTWNYDTFMTNYFEPTTSTYQSGDFNNLKGYLYITLGGYNWIIIGRNSSLNSITFTNSYAQSNESVPNFLKFTSYNSYANYLKNNSETTTDAGSVINSANSKGIVNTISGISRSYSVTLSSYNVVAAGEIPAGCVLCLCAGTTGNSYYDSTSSYSSYFPNSDLDTAMTNVYNSIKSAAGNAIQSTSLTTYGYNGSRYTTYTHSEYLFPLATNTVNTSQNYCVETYLNTDAKRNIDDNWWLRSGYSSYSSYAFFVNWDGSFLNYRYTVNYSFGVRPAFVLKLV